MTHPPHPLILDSPNILRHITMGSSVVHYSILDMFNIEGGGEACKSESQNLAVPEPTMDPYLSHRLKS